MMSRFLKPTYKIVPIDDVNYTLISTFRRAQKTKSGVCVVIGINKCNARKVANSDVPCSVLVVIADMVWGKAGESINAASVKSATLINGDEDAEELGMVFATDLVDFLDGQDKELADVMERHFIKEA